MIKDNPNEYELFNANSIFIQKNLKVLDKFKDEVAGQTFHAKIFMNAAIAHLEINKWVEKITKNKIRDIIPDGVITDETKLVLLNAIYFKGNWANQFDEGLTQKKDFYLDENNKVQTQLMELKEGDPIKYVNELKNVSAAAIEMPYKGGRMSMIVILPKDKGGLEKVEEQLFKNNDINDVQNEIANSPPIQVEISLPKFKIDLDEPLMLKDYLQNMGIKDVFEEETADLSGISEAKEKLFLQDVIHKAAIEVNEKGSEAAAASAAILGEDYSMDYGPPKIQFVCDHPFIFFIWDSVTNMVLFLGRFVDPRQMSD